MRWHEGMLDLRRQLRMWLKKVYRTETDIFDVSLPR